MPDQSRSSRSKRGEIKYWESDHTGLVHVLWDAKRDGLTLDRDADKIASLIMRSRWMEAVRHHARERS